LLRKRDNENFFLTSIFVGIFLFLPARSATANITNGTFDTDLSDWTPQGPVDWIEDEVEGGGMAKFSSTIVDKRNSSLSQPFTLEKDSKTLSFFVEMDTLASETDEFTASLDGGEPFYSWNSSYVEVFDETIVWRTEITDNSRIVNLNLDVSLLTGSHTLAFNLYNDYEDYVDTYIYIDNVNVSVIPSPDSLILCCIGSLSFLLFRRKVL
jgi:hypothetical protein